MGYLDNWISNGNKDKYYNKIKPSPVHKITSTQKDQLLSQK
jgi:predicted Zn-dependent protease